MLEAGSTLHEPYCGKSRGAAFAQMISNGVTLSVRMSSVDDMRVGGREEGDEDTQAEEATPRWSLDLVSLGSAVVEEVLDNIRCSIQTGMTQ